MYFRVYCAHITPIMFNNLSSYNLGERVRPLPFLIDSSDENEACYQRTPYIPLSLDMGI